MDATETPIEAEGVTFVYRSGASRPGRTGVSGVDLSVRPGERVIVMGPNGSGKTTLVRLIAGLLRPTDGRVRVLGGDPTRPDATLRGRLGVALDRTAHWEPLTGAENAYLLARAAGMDRDGARRACENLLDRFDLDGSVPVAEYSLGMTRRLLLAEAFAHAPEIVLLDEPTLGLDPLGVDALADLLDERARSGAASVVLTNDVAAAPRLGGRVVFLLDGRKALDRPLEDLLDDLAASTRIGIELDPTGVDAGILAASTEPPDGVTLSGSGTDLRAASTLGSEPLPELLRRVLERGGRIRAVQVRPPDLADAFRRVTGRPLEDGQ